MIFKKIIAYGDSWTVGEGWDDAEENKRLELSPDWRNCTKGYCAQPKVLMDMRNEHSWVRWLADKLNVPYEIRAVCGGRNYEMFSHMISDFQSKDINRDTLLICMWSSALRETVDFFPNTFDEPQPFVFWSGDLMGDYGRFLKEEHSNFEYHYKKYFVTELLDTSYFDYKSFNYKKLIEKYTEYYGIPFLQCNAFEPEKVRRNTEDTSFISWDKTYFKPNSSMFDEIVGSGDDIWQDKDEFKHKKIKEYLNALHPNTKGYKIIADILYEHIIKNDLHNRVRLQSGII
tara:strand:+ start:153 stop:1013 length:861 start_codon:yes stop_codon:yes gene_type:complete